YCASGRVGRRHLIFKWKPFQQDCWEGFSFLCTVSMRRCFVLGQCGVVTYRANATLFRRAGGALPLRSQRCFVASAILFVLAVWAWGLRAVLPFVLQQQAQ
ncbi:MAG: hypothetical protein EGR33_02350, partial [Prevotella sp.]|nr:hypothetical protein [Prevotella sp.]